MTKRDLIEYCLALPSVYEDYPFSDDFGWTVMRHRQNKKGFAHIFEREGHAWINLKCEPMKADFLRHVYLSVIPAYHMNKTHWNTIKLGGDVPQDELKRMIERSYNLIKPKVKMRNEHI